MLKINKLLSLLVLFPLTLIAQISSNSTAKTFEYELERAIKSENKYKLLKSNYAFTTINGIDFIGVSAIVDPEVISEQELDDLGIYSDTRLSDLWTFRVPVNNYSSFKSINGLKYIEIGEPVSELLDVSRVSARVDSVHHGLGGLTRAYTGKNVVVAVIDWGFDYTHPTFYDSTLSQYRVVRAWDQNKTQGNPPSGYNFGTEYIGKEQLLAGECDTNYVFGYSSHGTHVAGIAGGSGGGSNFIGAAPEAELIFISLRRDAPSLIDAFSYITNYAAAVNKPYVVNMSFGSHLGPHDGTSLKNYGIDILHGPGKIFVGSAGNNGTSNANFHLDKNFSSTPNDTLITVVGFSPQPAGFGQTLSMWGSKNSSFSANITLADNLNNIIYEAPFYNSLNEPVTIDTMLFGNDTLVLRVEATSSFFLNQKPNVRFEIKNTTPYKVVLKVASEDSHVHIWNNVRMNNRYTNWGVPLQNTFTGAVAGNNDYGLGEPAGVGRNVITVGSYRAEDTTITGIPIYGAISSFSSKGPTVDERVKPDISSTGQAVWSSVNSFDITQTSSNHINFEGKNYGFASFSGTSMSGPMVAGIVALMLEAFPNLSATQAKEILKNTARLDNYTGNIGPNGDLQWGWGKANALAAILASEMYASTEEVEIAKTKFKIYPNPTSDVINLSVNDETLNIQKIELFSLDGKTSNVYEEQWNNTASIDVRNLPKGVYLVRVLAKDVFTVNKVVIQ